MHFNIEETDNASCHFGQFDMVIPTGYGEVRCITDLGLDACRNPSTIILLLLEIGRSLNASPVRTDLSGTPVDLRAPEHKEKTKRRR